MLRLRLSSIFLLVMGFLVLNLADLSAEDSEPEYGPYSPSTIHLSFEEAIQMALRNNAQTLIATEQEKESRAQFRQVLSGLLPQFSGSVSQLRRTLSLTSIGFDPSFFPPGTPILVGPFSSFDARVKVVQTIFDWGIFNDVRAGKSDVRISRIQEDLAREQVANLAGISYIQSLQADSDLKSAQADMALARRMLRLAQDQLHVGVADQVDLARAQTQSAQNKASLIAAQTTKEEAMIRLKRALWIPQDRVVRLSDRLRYTGYENMNVERAVEIAEENRPEMQIARNQVKQSQQLKQAAIGQQIPSIAFGANYGASGTSPTENVNQTYEFGGQLTVPLFDGGKTIAGISAAASQKRQAEINLRDMTQQVSEDVRIALQQLRDGSAQVKAAKQALNFAHREMQLARDQFAAGVGDNVQVVQAQDSLAESRDAYVQALALYQTARINLATALGNMEDFEL